MAKTKTKNIVEECKSALQVAREELAKLTQIERDQMSMLDQYKEELGQMEAGRGERVLDALMVGDGRNTAWRESTEAADKQAQIDTANAVLNALGGRIKATERKVLECKADCLVAEADELDRQADVRQKKTDELLDQLWDWEGVEYVPSPPLRGSRPNVRGLKREFGAIGRAYGAGKGSPSTKDAVKDGIGVVAPEIVYVPTPITESMRRRAAFYRKAAEAMLKGGPVNFSGLPEYLK
jgi:hypothetical protein